MAQNRAEASSPAVARVGGVPLAPGDHVCVLYRGRAERNELMAPFFADGLREGHICLLLAAQGEGRAFCDVLATEVPSVGAESDHLQIKGPEESCLQDGSFDRDRMLALLHAWSGDMFRNSDGDFARLAADMSWAQPLVQPGFIRDLVRYEMEATCRLTSYPQVRICMYDLELFNGDLIIPLVKAHPRVWLSGMVVENPYYLAPSMESSPTAVGEN